MKLKPLFFGATLLLSAFTLNAQWVSFPVVFHVLYTTPQTNIHDTCLQHQLDVLNEDFSATNPDIGNVPAAWQPIIGNMNIGFEFALVDPQGNPTIGIERRQVTGPLTPPFDAHSFANGGLDPWPDTAYINIWVYPMQGGLLGFATFPQAPATVRGLDFAYQVVGRGTYPVAPYNRGRIVTHEMGHFFGLHHIWGDDTNCSQDDSIADTPLQRVENYSAHPVGTVITDMCTPSAPGIMWMNFMDYTDDTGMCFFTQGQVVWMTNIVNTYYASFMGPAGMHSNIAEDRSQYSVFPSPSATGIFQVTRRDIAAKTSVEVYDLQGRLILAPEYFENGSTTMQIDLSAYGNGTYSVVMRTETAAETKRVVIAR